MTQVEYKEIGNVTVKLVDQRSLVLDANKDALLDWSRAFSADTGKSCEIYGGKDLTESEV